MTEFPCSIIELEATGSCKQCMHMALARASDIISKSAKIFSRWSNKIIWRQIFRHFNRELAVVLRKILRKKESSSGIRTADPKVCIATTLPFHHTSLLCNPCSLLASSANLIVQDHVDSCPVEGGAR